MTKAVLGVMGGSGIYDLPGLEGLEEIAVSSPWGEPSDRLRRGRIGTTEIVFLPRHGRGHALSPSDINYRANIDALKRAGVTDLVSLSAVGSFKGELPPGHFVLADQFIDKTYLRASSFFGRGCVAHVALARIPSPRCSRSGSRRRRRPKASRTRSAERRCAWRGQRSRRSPKACSTRRRAGT
jgi:5'-methylthioadenosine phosphorylase